MFYSHFILAKKGSLGTVWMAAHLQHKLRKTQVAETNISSSVNSIIFPEVPIALRLSGHLLLGVVRIYSRKVDYLYHDCNETLTKLRYAFASVLIDLPEEATTAPFHSITIPETLELDAFEIDETAYGFTRNADDYTKTYEEITLQDQIHVEEEFTSFNLDEERFSDTLLDSIVPEFGPTEMDIDSQFHFPVCGDIHNNVEEENQRQYENDGREDSSNVEKMRDGVHVSPEISLQGVRVSPESGLRIGAHEEHWKRTEEPNIADYQFPEDVTLPEIQTSAASPYIHSSQLDPAAMSFGASREHHISVALRATPPNQNPAAKPRNKKRRFDEVIVLSNRCIKQRLDGANDLIRERRRANSNYSGVGIFHEPLISGMCGKLQELLKRKHFPPRTSPPPGPSTATFKENGIPPVTPSVHSNDIPEALPSQDFSPLQAARFEGYVSECRMDSEREFPASSVPATSGFDACIGDDQLLSPLRDTADFTLTHPPDDLDCLKADSPQTGSTKNSTEIWSVRTRAVAEYLRKSFKDSVDSPGKLNVKKILEGRTKKECARLFYEVLVLKSRGYIEANQENPYDDITLSLASGFTNLPL